MAKNTVLIAIFVFFVACEEVNFSDEIYLNGGSIVAVKTEPPIVLPGSEIEITAAIDDGKGGEEFADISVGSKLFANVNRAKLTIPETVSDLFDDDLKDKLEKGGYVDVPVRLHMKRWDVGALKYFRIAAKSDGKPFKNGANPKILLQYRTLNSNTKIDIKNGDLIGFNPAKNGEKLLFSFKKGLAPDLLEEDYFFSWAVSGSGGEMPRLVDFNEESGEATFDFIDGFGSVLSGRYRFYLLLKPRKSAVFVENAHYESDFLAFSVETSF